MSEFWLLKDSIVSAIRMYFRKCPIFSALTDEAIWDALSNAMGNGECVAQYVSRCDINRHTFLDTAFAPPDSLWTMSDNVHFLGRVEHLFYLRHFSSIDFGCSYTNDSGFSDHLPIMLMRKWVSDSEPAVYDLREHSPLDLPTFHLGSGLIPVHPFSIVQKLYPSHKHRCPSRHWLKEQYKCEPFRHSDYANAYPDFCCVHNNRLHCVNSPHFIYTVFHKASLIDSPLK